MHLRGVGMVGEMGGNHSQPANLTQYPPFMAAVACAQQAGLSVFMAASDVDIRLARSGLSALACAVPVMFPGAETRALPWRPEQSIQSIPRRGLPTAPLFALGSAARLFAT